MSWKDDIAPKTQKIEGLLIDVNWTLEEGIGKLPRCNDNCQKKQIIKWLKEARELLEDVLRVLGDA